MAAVERMRTSLDCGGPDAELTLAKIAELESLVGNFHTVGIPRYEKEARDRHTELAFAFADQALKLDCLELADGVYRRMIEFYVGNSYSGIRDRAKLGVDDVRARRAAGGGAASH